MFLPHFFRRRPLRAALGATILVTALAAALPAQAATLLGCTGHAATSPTPSVPATALLRLLLTRLAASARRATPRRAGHGPSHGSIGRCLAHLAPAR